MLASWGRTRGAARSTGMVIALATSLSLFGAAAFAQGVVTLETPAPPGSQPTAGPDQGQQAPTDPQEAMLAYVQCMRDHGVDMPDPVFTADGGVTMRSSDDGPGSGPGTVGGGPGMAPEFDEAHQACSHFMEAQRVQVDPQRQAEEQQRALAFAECMREHGVDMPDPQFTADGGIMIQIGGPGSEVPDEQVMDDAQQACNGLMGGPPPGSDASGDDTGPATRSGGLPGEGETLP